MELSITIKVFTQNEVSAFDVVVQKGNFLALCTCEVFQKMSAAKNVALHLISANCSSSFVGFQFCSRGFFYTFLEKNPAACMHYALIMLYFA